MQQERQLSDEPEDPSAHTTNEEDYTAHINELISEPAADNVASMAAQYILNSLYQLSSYLFSKKIQHSPQPTQPLSHPLELSFDSYLETMAEDMGQFQKIRAHQLFKARQEAVNMEAELLKCYQRVERIYFEENYILDMSYFQYFYTELRSAKRGGKERVEGEMEKLCECLDMVEINLFSQIHCKFQEYFKVVANFEYLKDSVSLHLKKLQSSRACTSRVKKEFLEKSVKLRRKIIQRQNIQKVVQLIKQVKSIKKLPQVLESILASSLPYESLSLLQSTKTILQSLKELHCLSHTSEAIRSMEVLVQNDLTKRYANDLFMYLEECHSREVINLKDLWKKIEVHTCLDKDSSFVLDQLNSSTNSALSDNPQLLEQLQLMDYGSDAAISSSTLLPRHEGREYQIAMILLQSYKYLSFSPEVTKIKVSNSLRMFVKRFEKELLLYLSQVVADELQTIKVKDNNNDNILEDKPQGEEPREQPPLIQKRGSEEEVEVSLDVVDKVSVEFYIKHLGVLNEIFKQTINRFLGYLTTLISEYEEQFITEWQQALEQTSKARLLEQHKKFKDIFQEECSMLPNIFKIVEEKIKYLLTLKNISSIDALQFYRWITTLKYWKRYFDNMAECHPLLNYQPKPPTEYHMSELVAIVEDNVKKAVQAMNLQALLFQLTKDYIQVFHKKTVSNEIVTTLEEDTWQSTEIPAEFSEILQGIFNPDGNALNASVTILDSSTSSAKNLLNSSKDSINKSRDKDSSRQEDLPAKTKIKLLKNNMLIGGVRYKVNLSFLVLCEWLGEYMKMARVLGNVYDRDACNPAYQRVVGQVYDKLFDLIESFAVKSKELIYQAKALGLGKIKSKGINAKHICLLCNCLSVVSRIAEDMLDCQKVEKFGVGEKRSCTLQVLQSTRSQLISKLTLILNGKIDKEIKDFLEADSSNTATSQVATKTSHVIITFFLQMVEVTDEYLEGEEVKSVLKTAFQTLSQKYLTHLLLKGGKQRADVEVLIEKLKFLRKYFPTEYENLQKQIPT